MHFEFSPYILSPVFTFSQHSFYSQINVDLFIVKKILLYFDKDPSILVIIYVQNNISEATDPGQIISASSSIAA